VFWVPVRGVASKIAGVITDVGLPVPCGGRYHRGSASEMLMPFEWGAQHTILLGRCLDLAGDCCRDSVIRHHHLFHLPAAVGGRPIAASPRFPPGIDRVSSPG